MAVGDLNGDGQPDLAVANVYSNTVSVLLRQGDGTFAAPVHYVSGSRPRSVTVADLNGDGRLDLAVANSDYQSGDVSVLLNQGDGTFAAPVHYAAGSGSWSITAADLNGDGRPDLAVANGGVSVLMNQGDGTFAAPVDYAAGWGSLSVAAADLNGDGRPDLAVASSDYHNSEISVLMNQGNGTFAAPVYYAAGSGAATIVAADLNGDGSSDLAVANWYINTVGVLLTTCLP